MIKALLIITALGGGVQHTYYYGGDLITPLQYEDGMRERNEAALKAASLTPTIEKPKTKPKTKPKCLQAP